MQDYPNASNSLGLASSPIIVDNTLIVQIENDSDSFVAGIDLKNGSNLWKFPRTKKAIMQGIIIMAMLIQNVGMPLPVFFLTLLEYFMK